MPRKPKAKIPKAQPITGTQDQPALVAQRKANGQWAKGYSGAITGDAARARRTLNTATIAGMQWAFDRYGKQAIEKVAKTQPAIFLKMLVLLVPRELEVTHSGGVKAMSDEQIEATIEAIKGMLAKRAGDDARDVTVTPDADASPALPQPGEAEPSP